VKYDCKVVSVFYCPIHQWSASLSLSSEEMMMHSFFSYGEEIDIWSGVCFTDGIKISRLSLKGTWVSCCSSSNLAYASSSYLATVVMDLLFCRRYWAIGWAASPIYSDPARGEDHSGYIGRDTPHHDNHCRQHCTSWPHNCDHPNN
jgi:hypothetical protein